MSTLSAAPPETWQAAQSESAAWMPVTPAFSQMVVSECTAVP